MFAKFDEMPSLPVQDIKEKPKCCGQRAITLTELALAPILGNAVTSQHGALLSDDIKALKTNR